ncbi:MAG: AAA family ATPase [Muribaculaceae bacterium]|nr:AAA family ATPase [Muribaculaceae bacterium]
MDSRKIPHAMLISGPAGIGKMQLARAFTAYLNCSNRINGDSCGICPACRRIEACNDPDIHYIYPIHKKAKTHTLSTHYAEEWKKMLHDSPYMSLPHWNALLDAGNSRPMIYVDEADAIAAAAAMSTLTDDYKVFIIWLPERMNAEAANKLLKVLEEPYEDTIFVAVSNQPDLILPTILSRMRRIEMRPPDINTVEKALIARGVSIDSARQAAMTAQGSLLKAFEALGNGGETAEFNSSFQDTMRAAYARNAVAGKKFSETAAALGREKIIRMLEYFARMVRENFIANMRIGILNSMDSSQQQFAARFAPFINAANVEMLLEETDRASADIARNANARLVLFDYFLKLMIALHRGNPRR